MLETGGKDRLKRRGWGSEFGREGRNGTLGDPHDASH